MKDVKDFNRYFVSNLSFANKLTDDFPTNYYFQPEVLFNYHLLTFGYSFAFYSTGSRIASKDYSADFKMDVVLNGYSHGFIFEYQFYRTSLFQFSAYSKFAFETTKLKHTSNLMVIAEDTLLQTKYNYRAKSNSAEPGIAISYDYKFLKIKYYAGYMFSLMDDGFFSDDEKKQKMFNPYTRNSLKPDWSGFRTGISLYFMFSLKRNN
jgi:hypothetical protein